MLRFILVAIFLLLYFLLGIPVLGILWLIGKVNKRSSDLAALRLSLIHILSSRPLPDREVLSGS